MRKRDNPFCQVDEVCRELSTLRTKDTQKLAACLLRMGNCYHRVAIDHVKRSFSFALFASVAGFLLFGAVLFLLVGPGSALRQTPRVAVATVGAVGGALAHFVAAINFYLYGQASKQMRLFHGCLEKSAGFLLANSLCANLEETNREDSRVDLIRTIATTTREQALGENGDDGDRGAEHNNNGHRLLSRNPSSTQRNSTRRASEASV